MGDRIRLRISPGLVVAIAVTLLVGIVGTYLLARSNAQPAAPAPAGLLKPVSLGMAPYQYVAYSSSLDQTRQATGIKQYFAAFVTSAEGCQPSWGGTPGSGLSSPRAAAILADISALRVQGGEVVISFGGANGTELASACATADELTKAYNQVIDYYQATRVDFDIEGPALKDQAGMVRRAEAVARLQSKYPDLQVWVTLPAHTNGLTADGLRVLGEFAEHKVELSGINIMAMNYNAGVKDMGKQANKAAATTVRQLGRLFPNDSEGDIWKTLMVTVMVGHNDTPSEIFTLEDADEVRKFATQNGIGTLSLWSVARDVACVDPATPQPSVSCSGVSQQPYDFSRELQQPASE